MRKGTNEILYELADCKAKTICGGGVLLLKYINNRIESKHRLANVLIDERAEDGCHDEPKGK